MESEIIHIQLCVLRKLFVTLLYMKIFTYLHVFGQKARMLELKVKAKLQFSKIL